MIATSTAMQLLLLAGLIGATALIVVIDVLDKRPTGPARFTIGFRQELYPDRVVRWTVRYLTSGAPARTGAARTLLGARIAARRARRDIEAKYRTFRARIDEGLRTGALSVNESRDLERNALAAEMVCSIFEVPTKVVGHGLTEDADRITGAPGSVRYIAGYADVTQEIIDEALAWQRITERAETEFWAMVRDRFDQEQLDEDEPA